VAYSGLLEFTLQRVCRPHKLKLELQPPDDGAPERSLNVLSSENYKYAAPPALDALNPFEVLFLAANPFHICQILLSPGGQFVSQEQKFNPLGV
jgi:hypothetical protein